MGIPAAGPAPRPSPAPQASALAQPADCAHLRRGVAPQLHHVVQRPHIAVAKECKAAGGICRDLGRQACLESVEQLWD
eukprot:267653-Chlamydomonas_euryale.AAC.1